MNHISKTPYRRNRLSRAIQLVGLSSISLLASSMVTAQAADQPVPELEEITVTGTYIRGAEVIGSAADVVDGSEIMASGKNTLGDYLRDIPANFAGGVGLSDEVQSDQDAGAANANLSGGQGVNLRGLGALSTLVLVNGRRVAASGQFGDFVDISNIPAAAVERVEILKDGASALYGSDAVGGVVNFVLKRKLDAPITSINVGGTTQGGGQQIQLSHLFGLDWDQGNAVFGVEYYNRDHVAVSDRDAYKNGSDYSSQGGVNWKRYSAHYSAAANIFRGNQGGSVASPVGASVPSGANANLSMSDLVLSSNGVGNSTNVYDAMDLLPETERLSLFASFDHDINDGVSLYGDIRYTERTSDYKLGYGYAVESSLPTTSPYYISGIDPSLTNTDGSIPFGLVIDDRAETRESSVDSLGFQLGLVADLGGDWQLDLSTSYSLEEQRRYREQLGDVSLSGTMNLFNCALEGPATTNAECAALGLEAFNPFSTEPVSEAQLDQIFGYEDLKFKSEVMQLTAKADGSLMALPAGDLKLAVGIDYREETISGDLAWNTGSITPRTGPYTETVREAQSAFFELAIPVSDRVDISLAGRYESFTGTGDYETFNPKLGLNWAITDGLMFKASWGTSFHAPAMRFENDDPQPLPGGNSAFLLPTFYQGPCDSDIVDFNGIVGTPGVAGQNCSFSILVNTGGAGEGVLSPEEAETWSMGLDWESESIEGLRASISYFNISVDDRIQRIQGGTFPSIVSEIFATGTSPFINAINIRPTEAEAQAVLDSAKYLGTFGPPIANSAADIQMIVNATQINIATLETSGFDYSLAYDFDIAGGQASVFVNGTWLRSYDTESAPGAGVTDQLGQYSSFGAPVELRSIQGISYKSGNLSGSLKVNYTAGYDCAIGSCIVADSSGAPVPNSRKVGIDSWVTVDLGIDWDLSDFGGMGEGVVAHLSVNNLFDEDAPFIDGGSSPVDNVPTAYDPNNHTVIGRTIGLTLTKRW